MVPPALNLAIAQQCARLGKPLLIEKPLAISGAVAAEIVALYSRHHLPLTVGQTLRYNGVIRGLREQLPSLGPLYSFAASQRLEPSTIAWHEDPEQAGAGVSFHTAVHVFDALRFITGLEVRRVTAICRQRSGAVLEDILAVLSPLLSVSLQPINCYANANYVKL